MVKGSSEGFFAKLGGYAIAALVVYGAFKLVTHNKDEVVKEAQNITYDVDGHKINDYGSLQNPVSTRYGLEGQAVGQEGDAEGYGAEISMITPGVGQNFHGRAFGL